MTGQTSQSCKVRWINHATFSAWVASFLSHFMSQKYCPCHDRSWKFFVLPFYVTRQFYRATEVS